jgi:hypothetical protein
METIETIIWVCGGSVVVCLIVVFGGGIVFLIHLNNRSLRKAAQSWHSTTGRILDTRVVPRVYFRRDITEAEAEALVRQWREEEKFKLKDLPKNLLAEVLYLFIGEFASEFISVPKGGGRELEEWPMVVYEYEVNGVKYTSHRLRVEDITEPTTGGGWYTKQLFKRYPKGAAVTVYYNPQDPKESALER